MPLCRNDLCVVPEKRRRCQPASTRCKCDFTAENIYKHAKYFLSFGARKARNHSVSLGLISTIMALSVLLPNFATKIGECKQLSYYRNQVSKVKGQVDKAKSELLKTTDNYCSIFSLLKDEKSKGTLYLVDDKCSCSNEATPSEKIESFRKSYIASNDQASQKEITIMKYTYRDLTANDDKLATATSTDTLKS